MTAYCVGDRDDIAYTASTSIFSFHSTDQFFLSYSKFGLVGSPKGNTGKLLQLKFSTCHNRHAATIFLTGGSKS